MTAKQSFRTAFAAAASAVAIGAIAISATLPPQTGGGSNPIFEVDCDGSRTDWLSDLTDYADLECTVPDNRTQEELREAALEEMAAKTINYLCKDCDPGPALTRCELEEIKIENAIGSWIYGECAEDPENPGTYFRTLIFSGDYDVTVKCKACP